MTIFENRRLLRSVTAVTLALTLVVGITVVATPWWKGVSRNVFTAYFPNTNGLYTGDEIRILGVAVGTVEKIEPQPNTTKVTFSVDSQFPIPADVKAAVLSPT
ncbi:MAG: phospholipid/cholesterol/gamma-HCH transport system substrate-binding protein, partial [Mycobacterium sp.]|nr:phospholipid/cholesterol/gamma-HCH transport system substrate-binding protein [Mycobacterium sp.]